MIKNLYLLSWFFIFFMNANDASKKHQQCYTDYVLMKGKKIFVTTMRKLLPHELMTKTMTLVGIDILEEEKNLSFDEQVYPRIKTWPEGIIPYVIDPKFSKLMKWQIIKAMKNWEKKTESVINFVPFDEKKHRWSLYFLKTSKGPLSMVGGYSYIGFRGVRNQKLGLNSLVTRDVILHEIGHALGLNHEQVRQDRDQYINVYWCNITPQYRFNFEKDTTNPPIGAYDSRSIMQYDSSAFSRNTLPTMAAKGKIIPLPILPNLKISKKDVQKIRYLYGHETK